MKKALIFLLTSLLLIACQKNDSNINKQDHQKREAATVGFNFSMPVFQTNSDSKQSIRTTQGLQADQLMTGELTVTNLETNNTENYNWSIYLDESNFQTQSIKSILLTPASYDFALTLTKENQQYLGQVSNFNIVDGTNDVPMVIKPVIGDTTVDISQLDRAGMIRFQYDQGQLTDFTTPQLGVSIDDSAETVYTIDPSSATVSNYIGLKEGEHKISLRFYEGDTQFGKSKVEQETVNIILGNNLSIDITPLEGTATFTSTESGGDAKLKFQIPEELVTEAGGINNLDAVLTIVSPKNPVREASMTVDSSADGATTLYFAESTLPSYHHDTIDYTISFLDNTKVPKEELSRCAIEQVQLDQYGALNSCRIAIKRNSITSQNPHATMEINVQDSGGTAIPGAKVKINDRLVGIAGNGTINTTGYLKHRVVKGSHTIKVEDIKVTTTDVSVDSLETKNLNITLNQKPTWNFVDGNGNEGINYYPTQSAVYVRPIAFNGKLYAIWSEVNGKLQVRVAVYSGNDSSPTWNFVDGSGPHGLNSDPLAVDANYPILTVFNNKLYATWTEPNKIRVAVYNGDDTSPAWKFVDTGYLNKDPLKKAYLSQLKAYNNKLYATWLERGQYNLDQTRVAVYNGNDTSPAWTFVDGNGANGINKEITRPADSPQLTVHSNKLYALWRESNGSKNQIRIAVYNGNDLSPAWNFVDGNGVNGINKNSTQNGDIPQLISFNNKLYTTWMEQDEVNGIFQIRIAVYNGDDASPSWTFIDGNGVNGLNKDPSKFAGYSQFAVLNNRLYITWHEKFGDVEQIRVAIYNNNESSPSWTMIDGGGDTGINKDPAFGATLPRLVTLNEKLYAFWYETNGRCPQARVAVLAYE